MADNQKSKIDVQLIAWTSIAFIALCLLYFLLPSELFGHATVVAVFLILAGIFNHRYGGQEGLLAAATSSEKNHPEKSDRKLRMGIRFRSRAGVLGLVVVAAFAIAAFRTLKQDSDLNAHQRDVADRVLDVSEKIMLVDKAREDLQSIRKEIDALNVLRASLILQSICLNGKTSAKNTDLGGVEVVISSVVDRLNAIKEETAALPHLPPALLDEIQLCRAHLHLLLGKPALAEKQLESITDVGGYERDFLKLWIAICTGRSPPGEIIDRHPKEPLVLFTKGVGLVGKQKLDKAIEAFRQARTQGNFHSLFSLSPFLRNTALLTEASCAFSLNRDASVYRNEVIAIADAALSKSLEHPSSPALLQWAIATERTRVHLYSDQYNRIKEIKLAASACMGVSSESAREAISRDVEELEVTAIGTLKGNLKFLRKRNGAIPDMGGSDSEAVKIALLELRSLRQLTVAATHEMGEEQLVAAANAWCAIETEVYNCITSRVEAGDIMHNQELGKSLLEQAARCRGAFRVFKQQSIRELGKKSVVEGLRLTSYLDDGTPLRKFGLEYLRLAEGGVSAQNGNNGERSERR